MDVVYYVACSVDGYIADTEGSVEWLARFHGGGEDYGYAEFYASVDALLMGSRTYEFALEQGEWRSTDLPSWVFTRRDLPVAHPSVHLTADDPGEVVARLRDRGYKRSWLMGGGELAAGFRSLGLISHYRIFVIPVVLGKGIPLFSPLARQDSLRLVAASPYPNGVVELRYVPGRDAADEP